MCKLANLVSNRRNNINQRKNMARLSFVSKYIFSSFIFSAPLNEIEKFFCKASFIKLPPTAKADKPDRSISNQRYYGNMISYVHDHHRTFACRYYRGANDCLGLNFKRHRSQSGFSSASAYTSATSLGTTETPTSK